MRGKVKYGYETVFEPGIGTWSILPELETMKVAFGRRIGKIKFR